MHYEIRKADAGPAEPYCEGMGLRSPWAAGGCWHKNGRLVDLLELSMPYAAREGWARKVEIWRHDGGEETLVQGAGRLPELCLLGDGWVLESELAEGDAERVAARVWYRITGERYQGADPYPWGLTQELGWYWRVRSAHFGDGPVQAAESALDGVMGAEDAWGRVEREARAHLAALKRRYGGG